MRIAVARAVSIAGHPVVLVLIAAMIAAASRGASFLQLRLVGAAVAALGIIVLGYSWLQVRAGRWSHVDASVRHERSSLNAFLTVLLLLGAALSWFGLHSLQLSVALALSGVLIFAAMLVARWVKLSLHTAFAAFATALLWPLTLAVLAGVLVSAAVAWSRLALGRHVVADVISGALLGTVAGSAYHVWIV
jgi:hypothetical protein